MCRYVVFATAPCLREDELAKIGCAHGLRHRRARFGEHVFPQNFSSPFRMGAAPCDCNTIIGLGLGVPEHSMVEPSASRKKKWSRARIERWRGEVDSARGRIASSMEREADSWTAFFDKVFTAGVNQIAFAILTDPCETTDLGAITNEIFVNRADLTDRFYLAATTGTRYVICKH